jgi:uncharacterized protein (DUF2235 family)
VVDDLSIVGYFMNKRLIVCCDGTWNTPDQTEDGESSMTNVARIAIAIRAMDERGMEQRVYYDKGVGTSRFDHLRGGAIGWGLSRKIGEAYRYLVKHYEPGDELFLFGFSRGAYTVRSLAGLIRNCGLLRRVCENKIPDAYELYRDRSARTHPRSIEARLFRRSYSHDVRIRFLGVWDTVGALGIPNLASVHNISKHWTFHDVTLSTSIDNAFHALAIDEHRKPFIPTLWTRQKESVGRLEQVWFSGAHSNVGGGYRDAGLSDIALEWMAQRASECGLALDVDVQPDPLGVLRDSMTWYYRRLGKGERIIGDVPPGAGAAGAERCESVHESAMRRFATTEVNYHPRNLNDYIHRIVRNTTNAQ